MTRRRSTCSSLKAAGTWITTSNERGTLAWPYSMSTSTSSSPTSQPLRAAYISIVMAVQAASAAATVRVGEGPSLAPPATSGSSMTSRWPPWISTSCVNPWRRRAVALTIVGTRVATLEQLGVVHVGEARHREHEVRGSVEVAHHRLGGELSLLHQRHHTALGSADDRPGDIELSRERRPAGDDELRRQLHPVHVAIDDRLERRHHVVVDPADPLLEPLLGLRRRRELGARDEELSLESQDVGSQLGVIGAAQRPCDAQRRAGLVDRPIGLGPHVGLGDPAAIPERGRAVIALARVDARHLRAP